MSKQITINKSFYDDMGKLEEFAKSSVEDMGRDIVEYAVRISPVDTGAYVESFSVVPRGAGGGRSRTSHGKPRGQNKNNSHQEAITRLNAELDAIDPLTSGGFTLRNRAPHANAVEVGGHNWISDGYYVFSGVKARFR